MSIFKKLFGSVNDETIENKEINQFENQTKNQLSSEETFTINFKKNGGKFIYCENLSELRTAFEDILEENDWFESEVICSEAKLFPFLEENKLSFQDTENPKFLFSCCENLIADEGSILLCSNQIKQYKPQELPSNLVIFATTNQVVKDKDDAMTNLRKRYFNGYPSNITTIKYFEKVQEEDFLHYGSVAKNTYLLLLEDI